MRPTRGAIGCFLFVVAACSEGRGVGTHDDPVGGGAGSEDGSGSSGMRWPWADAKRSAIPDSSGAEPGRIRTRKAYLGEPDAAGSSDAGEPEDAAQDGSSAEPLDSGIQVDSGMQVDAGDAGDAGGVDEIPDADADAEAGGDPIDGGDAGDIGPGDDDAGFDGQDAGDDAAVEPEPPPSWPCFGGDDAHSRAARGETHLSPTTASSLQLAWSVASPGVTGTPAVVDGIVYWSDWAGGVHAHRVEDGAEVWSQSFDIGFTSSPCVTDSHVYVANRRATVHALDRDSGDVAWSTEVDTVELTHLWSSPMVVDGVLVIGLAADGTQSDRTPLPEETIETFRGAVVGLDAEDGEILWRFEATRVEGEEDIYGPGVAVWSSAAIDREREAIFIGTGNGFRSPVSPYSDALLALRYRTGELAWAHQFTADDAFSSGSPSAGPDYDVGAAPNLFTIDDGGISRDVVGVGDKAGVYRVLDRDSGELIWERELEPVSFFRKVGGVIAPGAYGDGKVFVASNTSFSSSRAWALDAATGAELWESDDFDSVSFGAPAYANGVVVFGGSGFSVTGEPERGIGVGARGDLVVLDAEDGAELYSAELAAGRGGGFSVAEGRIFVGSGFSFFAWSDEPLTGALEVYEVPR